jgi:nicotinate-nucleotide pyrophosphorylase (carboxylating)
MEYQFDLDAFIRLALAEDIGDGDHTTLSTIPADTQGKAKLLVKENGIIAGVDIAQRVAEIVDPRLQFEKIISDGTPIQKGDIAFYLSGSSQSITTAERLISISCSA